MPSFVGFERTAEEDEDGNPGPNPNPNPQDTLRIIAPHIEAMQKHVNAIINKLEIKKPFPQNENEQFRLGNGKLLHEKLTECVAQLRKVWAPYSHVTLKVLLVDPVTANCLLYRNVLSRSEFNVSIKEVRSGEDAIRAHPASGWRTAYHVIIINRELPGITGTETTRTLRQMGVTSFMMGISVFELDEIHRTRLSHKILEFQKSGIHHLIHMEKFWDADLLMILATIAGKEVGDHVEEQVQKVIDIVNDYESNLGIKYEPADDLPQNSDSDVSEDDDTGN